VKFNVSGDFFALAQSEETHSGSLQEREWADSQGEDCQDKNDECKRRIQFPVAQILGIGRLISVGFKKLTHEPECKWFFLFRFL